MLLNINEIKVNPGRRELSQSGIEELAQSIAGIGLLNPISIDEKHTLIAGYHRLEAAKRLGWTEIECSVCRLEGLHAELAEIDENFVRTALTTTQRGELLLRRKTIYETLHPETRHGMRNGQTAKDCSVQSLEAKSFVQDTAEKLGVSPSTISRQVQAAKNTTPEAKRIIQDNGLNLTQQEALKLSRLEPEQQTEAATLLVTQEIASVDAFQMEEPQKSENQRSESVNLFADFPEFMQTVLEGIKMYTTAIDCLMRLSTKEINAAVQKADLVCEAVRGLTVQIKNVAKNIDAEHQSYSDRIPDTTGEAAHE